MSILTIGLTNKDDILKMVLTPLLYLSRTARVQCGLNYLALHVQDEERRTILLLDLNYQDIHRDPECQWPCTVYVNLLAIFGILLSSRRDDIVTIEYGSLMDGSICFEFQENGPMMNRRSVTQILDPPPRGIVTLNLQRPEAFGLSIQLPPKNFRVSIEIPSEDFRRALEYLDVVAYLNPTLAPDFTITLHANRQKYENNREVSFTAGEHVAVTRDCKISALEQYEDVFIRMAFNNIKSYIAASNYTKTVEFYRSNDPNLPDLLNCMIQRRDGVILGYYRFLCYKIPNSLA